jgi:hypothetical protein
MKKSHPKAISLKPSVEYGDLIGGVAELLEAARRNAARAVNALMTATYSLDTVNRIAKEQKPDLVWRIGISRSSHCPI